MGKSLLLLFAAAKEGHIEAQNELARELELEGRKYLNRCWKALPYTTAFTRKEELIESAINAFFKDIRPRAKNTRFDYWLESMSLDLGEKLMASFNASLKNCIRNNNMHTPAFTFPEDYDPEGDGGEFNEDEMAPASFFERGTDEQLLVSDASLGLWAAEIFKNEPLNSKFRYYILRQIFWQNAGFMNASFDLELLLNTSTSGETEVIERYLSWQNG